MNAKKIQVCLAVVAVWLAGAVTVHAQAGRTGTGGGGGGGGGGGFRPTTSSSSSSGNAASSTREYPNATLPGDATFSYDPETHSLVIMSDDATFAHISEVVSNLDRPKPQVLIKVVFLEVQHDNAMDLGVEGGYHHNIDKGLFGTGAPGVGASNIFGLAALGAAGEQIGQTALPGGAGLYSVMANDFQATVRAIALAGKVEVLSRPSVLVRNNQPATITVGQSIPLVTGVEAATAVSGPVSQITYRDVGIILQVTPFIASDGLVEMIVAPQISSLSSQTVQVSSNVNAPVIDVRSASTVVVTPDGQTVVIGGLMENDKTIIDSKIPVLGDIPLLGLLFKRKQTAFTKKELMIFLTPHVVNMPSQVASLTTREEKSGDLSHKAFSEQEMDKFFDRLPAKPHTIWSSPSGDANAPSPPPPLK